MTIEQKSLRLEKSSPGYRVRPLAAALMRAHARVRTWVLGHLPSESQHLFALTILVGMVCGVAAVAFHLVIRVMEALFIDRAIAAPGSSWMMWTVLTPTFGGLVAGALLTWVVPGARGSGVPQVKAAYATEGGRVRFRDAVGKFIIGALQIGCGASLGREGPTVQVCSGATSLLARLTGLPPRNMRRLTPVGVAAGIAAAFNAPIAAVTFTIEEIVGALDNTVLSGVVVAAALSAVIERGVLGVHPVIEVDQSYGLEHASSLVTYALLGVAAAVVSVIFTDGLLKLRLWFRNFHLVPQWAHPAIGGLMTGVLAVVVLKTMNVTGVTGGGYEALGRALAGGIGFQVLIALCAAKIIATVFSYSSGGAGGIFAPALFVGAMLGGAFGYGDVLLFGHEHKQLGSFALVGMGAVFAGVIRAPITSVLIIFEMTGGYGLVLPLMLANMTSYALARSWRSEPVYEALLSQDGIELPRGAPPRMHALERLTVADAMTSPARCLLGTRTLSEAVVKLHGLSFEIAPVVNERNEVLGGVFLAELRRSAALNPEASVSTLIRPLQTIRPGAPLIQAVVRMTELGVRQLCVIRDRTGNGLIGMVAMSDLVRTHAEAASTTSPPPGPLVPAPELKAQSLMRQVTPMPASTKLSELANAQLNASSYVIRQGEGYAVLTREQFVSLTRDKDFETVLRLSDVARTVPIVQPNATLVELSRLLQEANAPAAIVYSPRAQDQVGVVTRDVLANALLDWFSARVAAARAARPSARSEASGPVTQVTTMHSDVS